MEFEFWNMGFWSALESKVVQPIQKSNETIYLDTPILFITFVKSSHLIPYKNFCLLKIACTVIVPENVVSAAMIYVPTCYL